MNRVGQAQGVELLSLLQQLERLVAHRKGAAAGLSQVLMERLQHTQNAIAALRSEISQNPNSSNWTEQIAQLMGQLPPKERLYLQKFLVGLESEPSTD